MGARLGQHFLANPHVAKRIAQSLDIKPGDVVLEVGSGKGALTRQLLALGARVVGVEIDTALCSQLRVIFRNDPQLQVVKGDVLEVDLGSLFQSAQGAVKVAGNIPYKITSPLIERLTLWPGWRQAVLMVQQEVAARITAGPGTKTYGVLSVGVQLVAEARYLFGLSKNSFRPVPQVDSAVIELVRKPRTLTETEREQVMVVVRAAFSQRRKTIANSLAARLDLSKARVQEALLASGIDPGTRAETVDLEAYCQLSQALSIHTIH